MRQAVHFNLKEACIVSSGKEVVFCIAPHVYDGRSVIVVAWTWKQAESDDIRSRRVFGCGVANCDSSAHEIERLTCEQVQHLFSSSPGTKQARVAGVTLVAHCAGTVKFSPVHQNQIALLFWKTISAEHTNCSMTPLLKEKGVYTRRHPLALPKAQVAVCCSSYHGAVAVFEENELGNEQGAAQFLH